MRGSGDVLQRHGTVEDVAHGVVAAQDRGDERLDQPVHVPGVGAVPGHTADGLGQFAHLVGDGAMVLDQPFDEDDLVTFEHAGVEDHLVDQHEREFQRRSGTQEHGIVDRVVRGLGDRRRVPHSSGCIVAGAIISTGSDQCRSRERESPELERVAAAVARHAVMGCPAGHDVTPEVRSSGSASGSNTWLRLEARSPRLLSTVAIRASTTRIDAVSSLALTDS